MSDVERRGRSRKRCRSNNVERRGRSRKRCSSKDGERRRRRNLLSPVFWDFPLFDDFDDSLDSLRQSCDEVVKPQKPRKVNGRICKRYGGFVTLVNEEEGLDGLGDAAESALKLFNDDKCSNFKLLKVCKLNKCAGYRWLTFKAQEDGGKECHVFRGAVYSMGGFRQALFCEIKVDDEVTVLPDDDDHDHDSKDRVQDKHTGQ